MIDERDDALARERCVLEEAPAPEGMDARILAAYRREFGSGRGWRRSRRVPLPVAALVPVGLIVGAALVLRARPAGEGAAAPTRHPDAVQAAHYDPPLVTATSLAGFEPIDDVQAIVVGGSAR